MENTITFQGFHGQKLGRRVLVSALPPLPSPLPDLHEVCNWHTVYQDRSTSSQIRNNGGSWWWTETFETVSWNKSFLLKHFSLVSVTVTERITQLSSADRSHGNLKGACASGAGVLRSDCQDLPFLYLCLAVEEHLLEKFVATSRLAWAHFGCYKIGQLILLVARQSCIDEQSRWGFDNPCPLSV